MKSKQKRHNRRRRKRELQKTDTKKTQPSPLYFQAIELHRAGQLGKAKQLYCDVLSSDPNQAEAWHMLGMVLYQSGQLDEALDCLENAQKLTPSDHGLISNLGVVQLALKNLPVAQHWLTQAVAIQPRDANAHNNLGIVLMEMHEYRLAADHFQTALKFDPLHREALSNLGNSLQEQGRLHEAIPFYQKAIERAPGDAVPWNNLGTLYKKLKQDELAKESFENAISLDSGFEEAQVNLGNLLVANDQVVAALEIFDKLIEGNPNSVRAIHYRGEAFAAAGRHDAAVVSFRRAIELNPDNAFSYLALSSIQQKQGELQQAIANLRHAIRLRPDLDVMHSTLLFVMSSDPSISPESLFQEHKLWGQKFCTVDTVFTHQRRPFESRRRLRIGYVSPDLRKHAVTAYFEPVLVEHDQEHFETFCYSESIVEDEMTRHLCDHASAWRSTSGLSNHQVAQLIHEDKIDILVDLAGHTGGNRLCAFAFKPAPVQLTWLGYPNTTGVEAIEFRLTTAMQDPVGDETPHVEKLVRLPHADVIRPPAAAPATVMPPPVLQNGFITFGSLHRYQKLSPQAFDVWGQVLNAIPNSRLLAFNTTFNDDVRKYVRDQLVQRGVAAERLEIQNETTAEHYLELYHEIDIALDVFPWNGGTTTREALWMGVAVIGLYGATRSSRGTATALRSAGLDQLIAKSPQEYVEIAIRLAQHPRRIDCPAFDDARANVINDLQWAALYP